MFNRNLTRAAIVLAALAPMAHAQETTGSISGTVTDSSGAAIKGATVTLTNTDRNHVERTLTTDSKGFYTATSLPLGAYSVKIMQRGFKTELTTSLVLHVNDALTSNKTLLAGNEGEVVTVTADQVQLNLEDATNAGLVSGTQARELVLNNRNYEQLIQLQPGVIYGGANDQLYVGPTGPSGTSSTVAFSVNGGRSTANNWTVDGADNLDRGANLTLLVYPSVDAIAEFKTLRGTYTAQFGRSAAGSVNVITKSGTNNIHGSAYEFFRNDIFNANAWANKNVANPVNFTARPKLRYNDFGGTLGGPVIIPKIYNGRDKTFFFFSYEGRRVIQYSAATQSLVPTAAERAGDFTNEYYLPTGAPATGWQQGPVTVCTAANTATGACTATGTKITTFSPAAQAYIKDVYSVVPLPPSAADIASGLDPHTYVATSRNQFSDDQEIARVDQAIGSRLNVFYRYIHDSLPVNSGTGSFTTVPIPGISNTVTRQPGTTHLAHGTYVFGHNLLLDMGYAYSSGAILIDPVGALTTGNSPDINIALPYSNQLGVVPTISQTGFSALGSSGIYRDYNINHEAFASLTKVLGRHTLIAGVSYDHYQKRENATGGNQGSFAFTNTSAAIIPTPTGVSAASLTAPSSFANFLIGNVNSAFSQNSLAITPDIQEQIFEGYLQDNWKIAPRLTLNIGVRYSYFGQPIDANNRLTNFDPDFYDPSKAPTIASSGLACFTAPCANLNGLNSVNPNPNADYQGVNYLNGVISGNGAVAGHASPFGSKVGSTDNTNFAPRLGLAFDVFGDGKTAFRMGYGISYDESIVGFYENEVFFNPPAVSTTTSSQTSFDNPGGAAGTTPGTTPGRIYGSPVHYQTPYIQQYSLDVQQAITPTLMLDVGYFGNHATHLTGLVDLNEAPQGAFVGKLNPIAANPGTATTASVCAYPGTYVLGQPLSGTPSFISSVCDRALNQLKPYQGYFAIDAVRTAFSGNYNSLQVKVTKRFAGKSLIDANYTWSRNLTNNPNENSSPPQVTAQPNLDYGRATIDRTNVITLDAIYEIPFYKDQRGLVGHVVGGWQLSGIYAINSGLPLTATYSTLGAAVFYGYTNPVNGQTFGNYTNDSGGLGISGSTAAGFRPNQIADPNTGYGRQIHNKNEWFFRGAFASPLPGQNTAGTAHRGTINGPGFNRLDVGIFRNFRLFEDVNFQLRGEAFNVPNHTNFQAVTTTATSTGFGQVTSARDNRILQIGGKIVF